MKFPVATRTTAFLAGSSLAALAPGLDALRSRGLLPYDADSPELFPFIVGYFFVTVIVFVIGVRNLLPPELKTRLAFVYFPTDREGWTFLLNCWGRMLAWFIGGAVVVALTSVARSLAG